MRGEKPEVANPIVAWASQTGKGLLFFNKKGNTVHKAPESVLALYDATDLKKQSPHEIAFKLNGHEHVLKASSDNERDGWYQSIEKSMELGKAQKEEIRASEGYKGEMEKLSMFRDCTSIDVRADHIFRQAERAHSGRRSCDQDPEEEHRGREARDSAQGFRRRGGGWKERQEEPIH